MHKLLFLLLVFFVASCSSIKQSESKDSREEEVIGSAATAKSFDPHFIVDSTVIFNGRDSLLKYINTRLRGPYPVSEIVKVIDPIFIEQAHKQIDSEQKFKESYRFFEFPGLNKNESANLFDQYQMGRPKALTLMLDIFESKDKAAIIELLREIRSARALSLFFYKSKEPIKNTELSQHIIESLEDPEMERDAILLLARLENGGIEKLEELLLSGKSCCPELIVNELAQEGSSRVGIQYISSRLAVKENKHRIRDALKNYLMDRNSAEIRVEAAVMAAHYYDSLLDVNPIPQNEVRVDYDAGPRDGSVIARIIRNGDERIIPFLLKYRASGIVNEKVLLNINFRLYTLGYDIEEEVYNSFLSSQEIMLQIFESRIDQEKLLERKGIYTIAFEGWLGSDRHSVINRQATQTNLGSIVYFFKDVERDIFIKNLKTRVLVDSKKYPLNSFYITDIEKRSQKILDLYDVIHESKEDMLQYLLEVGFIDEETQQEALDTLNRMRDLSQENFFSIIAPVIVHTNRIFYQSGLHILDLENLNDSKIASLKEMKVLHFKRDNELLFLFRDSCYLVNPDPYFEGEYQSRAKHNSVELINYILEDHKVPERLVRFGYKIHFYGKEEVVDKVVKKYELHFTSFNW